MARLYVDGIDISIHAPHEGERHLSLLAAPKGGKFQSTLPTRGSDLTRCLSMIQTIYFNPRSPRGGATCTVFFLLRRKIFQSTLPTGGSDKDISRA